MAFFLIYTFENLLQVFGFSLVSPGLYEAEERVNPVSEVRIYTFCSSSDQWKAAHSLWSSWASTEVSGHSPVYIHKNGDHWDQTKWEFGTIQKPREPDGWTSGRNHMWEV